MANLKPLLKPGKMTNHETPESLFWLLYMEFGPFTLDVCADATNHKLAEYFDIEDNGLAQTWSGICYANPPYGREIIHWVHKARIEARDERATTVMLLPARTDTQWWHKEVMLFAKEICFLEGRVKFVGNEHGAPFPSVVVVFAPWGTNPTRDIERWPIVSRLVVPKGAR